MSGTKRIVIVTPDVRFGIAAKESLEKANYRVSTFSSGVTAVDFVRENPKNLGLALIDFRIQDMPGTDMIDHMRTMSPDLIVIAAPDHPAVHKLNARYQMYKIINLDLKMPELMNLIDNAFHRAPIEAQDKRRLSGATDQQPLSSPPLLEFWLADDDSGDTVIEDAVNYAQQSAVVDDTTLSVSEPDETGLTATGRFRMLWDEEPPPPTFSEGGTISQLRQRLTSVEDIQATLARKIVTDDAPDVDEDETDTTSTPAVAFLATALDESTPIERFTIDEFMDHVRERGVEGIEPLPSWRKEDGKYVDEPDFLNQLPQDEDIDQLLEYTSSITISMQPIDVDPTDWPTDPLEPMPRSRPHDQAFPPSLPEAPAVPLDDDEAARHIIELGPAKPPTLPEMPPVTMQDSRPFEHIDDSDPQLAQLATTLIQVSLDVTADATVLAHEGKIIAYAGRVTPDDIDVLRDQLTIQWDQSNGTDKSRILFANVPESGEEYMISTRATDSGFTLSLIFRGMRPLTEIRRQSKALLEALEAVPAPPEPMELPSEAEIEAINAQISPPSTDEIGVRQPIAFLWLLREPDRELDNSTQQQLLKTLDMQLTGRGWKLHDLQAPDYVYLYGDMPQGKEPRAVLRELMAISAPIVDQSAGQPADVWDDSYLILQPGREMTAEEIQRFINFARL